MKKDRLAHLPLRAPAGKENDAAYWKSVATRQMDMLASYKRRQDDIVLGLGKIQKRPDLADVIVQGILETSLSVAEVRVRDREEALTVAVAALVTMRDLARAKDSMDVIKHLCPDLFETVDGLPAEELEAAVKKAVEKKDGPKG